MTGEDLEIKPSAKKRLIFEDIAKVSKNKNAKKEAERLEKMDEIINYDRLLPIEIHKKVIKFNQHMSLHEFAREIFFESISLKKAEKMQDKTRSNIEILKKYNPKIQDKTDLQKIILENAQKLFEGRDAIIGGVFFNFIIQNLNQ